MATTVRAGFAALTAWALLSLAACGGGSGGGDTGGADGGNVEAPVLDTLMVSNGQLVPSFDPAKETYTLAVELLVPNITMTPTGQSGVAIEVNGVSVSSGSESDALDLPVGATPLSVDVSQDGATRTYTVLVVRANTVAQEGFLKASNVEANDCFGGSVAISGDTLVVGAILEDSIIGDEDDNSIRNAGAAYVFVRNSGQWSQQAILKAPNADLIDIFGSAVGISGETIVVGARNESSNGTSPANNDASVSGAAYVFVRNGTTWTQQAFLKASNVGSGDRFGTGVAISGNTLAVAAPSESSNGVPANNDAPLSGAVYMFVRTDTTWTEQAYLKAPSPKFGGQFGKSVAISLDSLIVGEPSSQPSESGAAYVFDRVGTNWILRQQLRASNVTSQDGFGRSVWIEGETAVVGAPGEDTDAAGPGGGGSFESQAGAAYVFVRSSTLFTQQAVLKASNAEANDAFGTAVSIDGDAIVVGANGEDSDGIGQNNNGASASGSAYLFTRSGTTWTQQAFVKASNTEGGDSFGEFVAISDQTVLVSAHFEDSDGSSQLDNSAPRAGAAYVVR